MESNFNEFRNKFNEENRCITFAQFRALPAKTLNKLIEESKLSIPDEGQVRLFHSSGEQHDVKYGKIDDNINPAFSFLDCMLNGNEMSTQKLLSTIQKAEMTYLTADGIQNEQYVLNSYKTNETDKVSFPVQDDKSSATYLTAYTENCIPINTFRRFSSEYVPDMYRIDLNRSKLFDVVETQFPNLDLKKFITDQSEVLQELRKLFYNCCFVRTSERNEQQFSLKQKHINELTFFQPIFQSFLENFATGLSLSDEIVGAQSIVLDARIADELHLVGFTDLMIFEHTANTNASAVDCHSIVELKSPFGDLYRSGSAAAKDQLCGELTAVANLKLDMKKEMVTTKQENLFGEEDSISNKKNRFDCVQSNVFSTLNKKIEETSFVIVGALTDLFCLNIMFCIQDNSNSKLKCYITSHILDAEDYLLHLILLFLDLDQSVLDVLFDKNNAEFVPIADNTELEMNKKQNKNIPQS
jgi:hypothetical protein